MGHGAWPWARFKFNCIRLRTLWVQLKHNTIHENKPKIVSNRAGSVLVCYFSQFCDETKHVVFDSGTSFSGCRVVARKRKCSFAPTNPISSPNLNIRGSTPSGAALESLNPWILESAMGLSSNNRAAARMQAGRRGLRGHYLTHVSIPTPQTCSFAPPLRTIPRGNVGTTANSTESESSGWNRSHSGVGSELGIIFLSFCSDLPIESLHKFDKYQ